MSSENKQEEDSTLKRGEKRGKEGDAQGSPARQNHREEAETAGRRRRGEKPQANGDEEKQVRL